MRIPLPFPDRSAAGAALAQQWKDHAKKPDAVILVDDGAATGSTLFAAIDDLRSAKVKKLIVALPVCPPDTAQALKKRCDEFIVLATPEPFEAVGKWYEEFPQVEDEEAMRLLAK